MAVKILFRLTDGPGGRNKGDILAVKDDPHGTVTFGKMGKSKKYGMVSISDITIKDCIHIGNRHYAEYLSFDDETADNAVFRCRSEFKIDIDSFSAEDQKTLSEDKDIAITKTIFCGKTEDIVKSLQKDNSLTERDDQVFVLTVSR